MKDAEWMIYFSMTILVFDFEEYTIFFEVDGAEVDAAEVDGAEVDGADGTISLEAEVKALSFSRVLAVLNDRTVGFFS